MDTKLIHISHAMPVEILNDLALTATGGIGYWAQWLRLSVGLDDEGNPVNDDGDYNPPEYGHFGKYRQFDEATGEPFGDEFTLDADLIAKGIEACSKVRPDIWHRFATDVIDGSADIDACDTIVQFGVFGELVYG
jgi:hypothetical protein